MTFSSEQFYQTTSSSSSSLSQLNTLPKKDPNWRQKLSREFDTFSRSRESKLNNGSQKTYMKYGSSSTGKKRPALNPKNLFMSKDLLSSSTKVTLVQKPIKKLDLDRLILRNDEQSEDKENASISYMVANPIQEIKSKSPQHNQVVFCEKTTAKNLSLEETSGISGDVYDFSLTDSCDVPEIQLEGAPKGLKNLGNTCYMNSVVQSLFSFRFFIEALVKCFEQFNEELAKKDPVIDPRQQLPILCSLVELFQNVESCSSANDTEKYLRAFKSSIVELDRFNSFKGNQQQDAGEFFSIILEALTEEIDNCLIDKVVVTNPVRNFFQSKQLQEKICIKCNKCLGSSEVEASVLHLIFATDDRALQTAFCNYLSETDSSTCPTCSCKTKTKKYFIKLPKVLFFQAGRCLEDYAGKDMRDVVATDNIRLPQEYIRLPKEYLLSPLATPYKSSLKRANVIMSEKKSFVKRLKFDGIFSKENDRADVDFVQSVCTEQAVSDETSNVDKLSDISASETLMQCDTDTDATLLDSLADGGERYQLVSIICHIGDSMMVGHFISYVFNFEHSKWFKCNDKKIEEVSFSEVLKESSSTSLCYFYVHTNE